MAAQHLPRDLARPNSVLKNWFKRRRKQSFTLTLIRSICLFCDSISWPMSIAMCLRLPMTPATWFRFSSISSSRASFVTLRNNRSSFYATIARHSTQQSLVILRNNRSSFYATIARHSTQQSLVILRNNRCYYTQQSLVILCDNRSSPCVTPARHSA